MGEEVLYPETVILIKDRERIIESVYLGTPAVAVLAKNIPCNALEIRAALEQALAEGWEFFCAILPSGYAKFWLQDTNWLGAAEKIASSLHDEAHRRMPGNNVKH